MDQGNIDRDGEPVQTPDTGVARRPLSDAPPDPFTLLWRAGYTRLVPIVPPHAELSPRSSLSKRPQSRGKTPGVRNAEGLWHGYNWHTYVATEADLARWAAMGAGVGLRLGDGLVAIDADTLEPALAEAALRAAYEILGPAPRRIGRDPKFLLLYRTPDGVEPAYQRVEFMGADAKRERVELLDQSRQNVMLGLHPFTLKLYEWPDGLPARDKLTVVTQAQIDAYFARLQEILPEATADSPKASVDRSAVDQNTLVGPQDAVTAAVEAIPNDTSDRELFVRMGAAIKAAGRDWPDPEDGFDVFWSWCDRWSIRDKDYDSAFADWNRLYPPFKIGAPFLYGEAAKHTGRIMTPTESWFETVADDDPDLPPPSERGEPEQRGNRQALVFRTFDDWADTALHVGAKPLVKGLLDQGAMTVLYGESNAGKTFVALDIGYHVSRGLPWGGMKTTGMVVAYIVLEGGPGSSRRLWALREKFGQTTDFFILVHAVDLLRPDADLKPLIEALRILGDRLGLVVIDTLSRAMAGGDENSSTDMGAMVRNLDRLRLELATHLMVVHHTGKDKAKGARGHSLLRAATDTEIEVSPGQIQVTKQRELAKDYAAAFALDLVTLGKDEDGDPITSCTVRLLAHRSEAPQGVPTPKQREVLKAFDACAAGPSDAVTTAALAGTIGAKDDTIRVRLRGLVEKGLVEQAGRAAWRRARAPSDPSMFFREIRREAERDPSSDSVFD